jgi:prepilin-type N-terminal cleavage/methylation domain-containing protein
MKETNTMKTAFTLIEILIVVILLGVLAAIVVPQFASATEDAKTSSCQTNMAGIKTAAALYLHKEGVVATAIGATGSTTTTDLTCTSAENGGQAYLPSAPVCPGKNGTVGTYDLTGHCTQHDALVP